MNLGYYVGCSLIGVIYGSVLTRQAYTKGMRLQCLFWFSVIVASLCLLGALRGAGPASFGAGLEVGLLQQFDPEFIFLNLVMIALYCLAETGYQTRSFGSRYRDGGSDNRTSEVDITSDAISPSTCPTNDGQDVTAPVSSIALAAYGVLGIEQGASEQAVREAYKDLVKVWNP